jgi:hypothetical protein
MTSTISSGVTNSLLNPVTLGTSQRLVLMHGKPMIYHPLPPTAPDGNYGSVACVSFSLTVEAYLSGASVGSRA